MGLAEITQGKKWKNFMAKLYGLGAAVVIVGALFKIMHWPFAGPMLVAGLGTEAVIFFFSAFEPPHEEVDWSLVYPELAGMHDDEDNGHKKLDHKRGGSVSEELDRMLEDAKIGPELIESLGTGLRTLGENTSKLADITDASIATTEYTENIKSASSSVEQFASSSLKASQAMSDFTSSSDEVRNYNEQVQSASRNMAALNALYELQLQDTNSQLSSTKKFHEGMVEMMSNLNASVEQTAKYKEEITTLAKNLSALNTVYGNMLSAMNINNNRM
jgi:gliding motility-associated protein GldL